MLEQMLIYPLKNIMRKKGRSFITILGVAIGVCSVIIINSIGVFGTTAVNTEIESLGLGGLTIAAKNSSIPLGRDELNTIKSIDGVISAMPVFAENSEALSSFGKSENSIIWGIDSNAKDIVSLKTVYGRDISRADIVNNACVCVVDQTFARNMFGKDNAVGHMITLTIKGNTQDFKIAGVIKTGSGLLQSAMGSYVPNFIYVPYTTVQHLTGAASYNQIITKADSCTDLSVLSRAIEKKLTALNSESKESYKITNLAKQKESLTNILSIVTSILSAVSAVSLIVAGLSIMTVMLVSVGERKREIGIKKAIGAGRAVIVREFLSEALILSFTGCILGAVMSFFMVLAGGMLVNNSSLSADLKTVIVTCIISLLSGVVFGVYPALKASKLNPANSLRSL